MQEPHTILLPDAFGLNAAAAPDGAVVTCYADVDEEVVRLGFAKTDLERDRAPLQTWLRTSRDSGRTWSDPRPTFRFPGGRGVACSPVVLVDRAGTIHAFSVRIMGYGEWGLNPALGWSSLLLHTMSHDGGATWTDMQSLDYGYRYNGNFNCVIQLDSGRMLLPTGAMDDSRKTGRFVAVAVFSDDGGRTWRRSGNCCAVNDEFGHVESGADEPVCAPLRGGMVWMVIRTATGYLWESFSSDGQCWTPARRTRLVSSNAPAGVLRLRDGRIALFWNNLYGEPFCGGPSYARQVLHGAISEDNAQTWSAPRPIACRRDGEPPNTQVTYPFPCQAADGSILVLYSRIGSQPGREWNNPVREVARVEPDWLGGAE